MNPLALMLFLVCAAALLAVPRKWAPVPLLLGCTYMTLGQGIELGPISLPVYRLLLLVGALRAVFKGESLPGGSNGIDKLMMAWSSWMIFASFFHDPNRAGFIYSSGVVFNVALAYFLIRIWCTDLEEVIDVIRIVALLMIPIAIVMIAEKVTGKNMFAVFGGVPENVLVRDGKLRAQGPFRHPILAGTVGATCIPLFLGILKRHKVEALAGCAAGLVITFASASSGPLMSLIFGMFALALWKIKRHTGTLRLGAVLLYILLMFVMNRPPYFLIGEIDLSGGSTGWHRSFLIQQTILYLPEWWLFGTDVTRHWMPFQGFGKDPLHTDITNYYIGFGVDGGLAAMLLVIAMMAAAFRWVGQIHDTLIDRQPSQAFMIWCFGACLFAHAGTSISVAYFDQSMMYFWLSIAVISSIYSVVHMKPDESATAETDVPCAADLAVEPSVPALEHAEWRRRLRERSAAREGIAGVGPINGNPRP